MWDPKTLRMASQGVWVGSGEARTQCLQCEQEGGCRTGSQCAPELTLRHRHLPEPTVTVPVRSNAAELNRLPPATSSAPSALTWSGPRATGP